MKENKIKELITKCLVEVGENPYREGLIGTPERIERMWLNEVFMGYNPENEPKVTVFNNGNDGVMYDEMISDSGSFYSMCEHHMVPFFGKYYFAYIPRGNGSILGLSKVSRVVEYYSRRLQVQERLTTQVVEHLWDALVKDGIRPIGMGLVIEAEHLCKSMRGAKNKGKMRTVALKGKFKTDASVKSEFLNFISDMKDEHNIR